MSFNKPIGGSGFGNAFDLSSLKKPAADQLPTVGLEVTQENLVSEFVAKSKEKVVVLLAWSPRSAQAKEILETLGKLEKADNGAWILGTVNVDAQPEVAQACK
jgi:putative thioredoxin